MLDVVKTLQGCSKGVIRTWKERVERRTWKERVERSKFPFH